MRMSSFLPRVMIDKITVHNITMRIKLNSGLYDKYRAEDN